MQARWTSGNTYPGTLYTTSSNGWMEEPIFNEWLTKSFIPHVIQMRLTRNMPNQAAILVYDGHKTHISYRIIKAALDNNIQLVKLPAHLSDKLQPLDKSVFKPVKDEWENKLIIFAKKQLEKRESGRLSKCHFAELLGEVWKSSMKRENIVKGFSSTGIFPHNLAKFPESLFDPIDLAQYKNKKQTMSSEAGNTSVNERPSTSHSSSNIDDIPLTSLNNDNVETFPDTNEEMPYIPDSNNQPSLSSKILPSAEKLQLSLTHSPQSIIEIFSSKLHSKPVQSEPVAKRKEVIPRLKPLKYGEILTSQEVLIKQKEAEELRANKNKGKSTKRTNKNKKAQNEPVIGDTDQHELPANKECAENASSQRLCNKRNQLDKSGSKRKKTGHEKIADDDDDFPMETTLCDDDSDDDLETYSGSISIDATPEIEYESPVWSNITLGKFLLVDFKGGRRNQTHYTYVCRVEEVDDEEGEIVVQAYRKRNSLSTEFSTIPKDISGISLEMVVAILPDPENKQNNGEAFSVFIGRVAVHEK